MSAHRDEVRNTVDMLHESVIAELSLALVQQFRTRGVGEMQINPDETTDAAGSFAEFDAKTKSRLRAVLEQRRLRDLQVVEVAFKITSARRIARCTIEGGRTAARELEVVTIKGRSRIQTRWVHMWQDWEHTCEWPDGWSASLAV